MMSFRLCSPVVVSLFAVFVGLVYWIQYWMPILQILRGIRVIKIYRGEEQESRRATDLANRFFEASIEISRYQALSRVFMESIAGFSIVLVVIVGGFEVLRGDLGWPGLLAFLLAIRSVHGPLNNVNAAMLEIQKNHASFARVTQLLAEKPAVMNLPDARPLAAPPRLAMLQRVAALPGLRALQAVLKPAARKILGKWGR